MEFSLIGFIIVIVILAPNFLLLAFPPRNTPKIKDPAFIFTLIERIGQVSCILLLIVSGTRFETTLINIWFFLMIFCIITYYCLWFRYFVNSRNFSVLFKSLGIVPIPMAIFPVLAFGFAAIWAKSSLIVISVIFIAVGHLTVSWNTCKYIKET